MLNFQFAKSAGFGEILSPEELGRADHELWDFFHGNPGFVAIRFDEKSATDAGHIVLMNRNEIKSVSKR